MKRHVMLDLETLGTKPGCPVISIGAVIFINAPEYRNDKFYVSITPKSQEGLMDAPDPETLIWWSKQSKEAQDAVFNDPLAMDIIEALHRFKNFLRSFLINAEDEIIIWGKGATFDEPIIKEAFDRCLIPIDWTFRNSLCYRTLEEMAKMFNVELPEFKGVKHNALADAYHQAECAKIILSTFAAGTV